MKCQINASIAAIALLAGFSLSSISLAYPASKQAQGESNDKCFSPDLIKPGVNMDRGVLNKYARRLPQPKYPLEARARDICGEAEVEVVVDIWSGKVYWARIKSGHILLQEAVKKVVCKASFWPVVGEGPPAWVGGILKYSFRCRKGSA